MAELIGSPGADTLIGTGEDDEIRGLAGNDILSGRNGSDTLFGGEGEDTLRGGDGDDTLIELPSLESDVLRGGAGFDLLDLARLGAIVGGSYEPLFVNLEKNLSRGIGGNDRLFDIEAVVAPDAGSDFPVALNDTLKGDDESNLFSSGVGNDWLVGRAGGDTLFGASGDDFLKGCRGRDSLNGGDDADTLRGGRGNDFLDGGAGHDLLSGGGGDDVFRFATRTRDVVTDFDPSADRLLISTLLVADFAALTAQTRELGDDLHISLDGGGQIILLETTLDALTPENVVFFGF